MEDEHCKGVELFNLYLYYSARRPRKVVRLRLYTGEVDSTTAAGSNLRCTEIRVYVI